MIKIKHLWTALNKREYTGLLLLLLIILALHLATIMQPAKPVFDEQYYVPSAHSILQGTGTDRIEHPPLGQLFIASGIQLFGDNPFGWRIFPVIFGLAGIIFLYLICRQLKMPQRYAYLAAFLFSFENLNFIQSNVAMLDVFSLTFMLAAFWLYLKGRYISSGIIVGLATLAKLTGILILPVIILHWILTNSRLISFSNFIPSPLMGEGEDEGVISGLIKTPHLNPLPQGERRSRLKSALPQYLKNFIIFVVTAPLVFLLLMPLLDFTIWHKWLNPLSQIATMLDINAGSTFAKYPSEMLSRPWDWLLHPGILTYWIDPHYLAMVSPTIWSLIIPAIIFAVFKAFKGNAAAIFTVIWFAGTYLVWIPFSLMTDRISYIYYFYPAIGSICVALSLLAEKLENITRNWPVSIHKKLIDMIVPVYLLLCLGAFAILSPVSYWWKAPLCVVAYLVSRYYMSQRPSEEILQFGNNSVINRQEIC